MLEGIIRTPEGFRSVSGTYRSNGGVTGTPRGKIWALWAIGGRLTSPQGVGAPPHKGGDRIGLGKGAPPPFLLLLPLLSLFPLR